jgi:hypothetical protein
VIIEVEQLYRGDPEHHCDQRARNAGRHPPQTDDHDQRQRPNQRRQPLRISEMRNDVPELREEIAAPLLDSQELGELADDDR